MNNIIGLKLFSKKPDESHQSRIENAIIKNKNIENHTTNISVLNQSVLYSYKYRKIEEQSAETLFFDETKRYVILLDGEIYNSHELKNELLKNDVTFSTSTEIEVLLKYIVHNGTKGLKKLNGAFAFVFYDSKEDEMLLVRDQLGIKPILFSIQDEMVLFASDLFCFKNLLDKTDINPKALNDYFRFTYVPAPDTMILGVHKLLPGYFLKVKGKDIDIIKYYSVRDVKKTNIPYEKAVEELRVKLEDSVLNRLGEKQSCGTFLSGGIDSSIVSQIASKHNPELNTFSVGFVENVFFDESEYAENTAKHIGSNHHLIKLGREEIINSFEDVFTAFDEPYGDSGAVAMYFLIQKTKEIVSTALSGDGADELLAGYNKHKAYLKSNNPGNILKIATKFAKKIQGGSRRGKISNRLRQLKKFGMLLQYKWPETYWYLAQHISKKRRDSLLINSKFYQNHIAPGENSLTDFIFTDQEFLLPNDMLKKVDVMARHHGFTVIPPFLSIDFVNFVNSLPDNYKLNGNTGKRILRDAFKDKLPNEVFMRPKKGFEIPLYDWIKSAWDKIVDPKWSDETYLNNQGLFSYEGVIKLIKDFNKGNEEDATVSMWVYIVFQNWYDRWKEK